MSPPLAPPGTQLKLWELTKPANPATHNESKAVDVVAVPGLDGEPDAGSWRSDNGKLWLRDFLPKDVRHARVFEFTYNPKELFVGSSAAIEPLVRDLLFGLRVARADVPQSRPVVFVCHGFGGFVVEEAINYIADSITVIGELRSCVKKIIFLSTPQRAPDELEWKSQLGNSMADSWAPSPFFKSIGNTEMLQLLGTNAAFLRDVTVSFRKNVARLKIKILACYEDVPTPHLMACTVTESNVALDLKVEKLRKMSGCSYSTIARYSNKEDENYQAIMSAIKKVLRSASQEKEKEKEGPQINISVNFQPSIRVSPSKPTDSPAESVPLTQKHTAAVSAGASVPPGSSAPPAPPAPPSAPIPAPAAMSKPQPQRQNSAPVPIHHPLDHSRSISMSELAATPLQPTVQSTGSRPGPPKPIKPIARRPLPPSLMIHQPTRHLSLSGTAGQPVIELPGRTPNSSKAPPTSGSHGPPVGQIPPQEPPKQSATAPAEIESFLVEPGKLPKSQGLPPKTTASSRITQNASISNVSLDPPSKPSGPANTGPANPAPTSSGARQMPAEARPMPQQIYAPYPSTPAVQMPQPHISGNSHLVQNLSSQTAQNVAINTANVTGGPCHIRPTIPRKPSSGTRQLPPQVPAISHQKGPGHSPPPAPASQQHISSTSNVVQNVSHLVQNVAVHTTSPHPHPPVTPNTSKRDARPGPLPGYPSALPKQPIQQGPVRSAPQSYTAFQPFILQQTGSHMPIQRPVPYRPGLAPQPTNIVNTTIIQPGPAPISTAPTRSAPPTGALPSRPPGLTSTKSFPTSGPSHPPLTSTQYQPQTTTQTAATPSYSGPTSTKTFSMHAGPPPSITRNLQTQSSIPPQPIPSAPMQFLGPTRPFSLSGPSPAHVPAVSSPPPIHPPAPIRPLSIPGPSSLPPGLRTGPQPIIRKPTPLSGPPAPPISKSHPPGLRSGIPPNRHSVSGPPVPSMPKSLQSGPAAGPPPKKPGFFSSIFGSSKPSPLAHAGPHPTAAAGGGQYKPYPGPAPPRPTPGALPDKLPGPLQPGPMLTALPGKPARPPPSRPPAMIPGKLPQPLPGKLSGHPPVKPPGRPPPKPPATQPAKPPGPPVSKPAVKPPRPTPSGLPGRPLGTPPAKPPVKPPGHPGRPPGPSGRPSGPPSKPPGPPSKPPGAAGNPPGLPAKPPSKPPAHAPGKPPGKPSGLHGGHVHGPHHGPHHGPNHGHGPHSGHGSHPGYLHHTEGYPVFVLGDPFYKPPTPKPEDNSSTNTESGGENEPETGLGGKTNPPTGTEGQATPPTGPEGQTTAPADLESEGKLPTGSDNETKLPGTNNGKPETGTKPEDETKPPTGSNQGKLEVDVKPENEVKPSDANDGKPDGATKPETDSKPDNDRKPTGLDSNVLLTDPKSEDTKPTEPESNATVTEVKPEEVIKPTGADTQVPGSNNKPSFQDGAKPVGAAVAEDPQATSSRILGNEKPTGPDDQTQSSDPKLQAPSTPTDANPETNTPAIPDLTSPREGQPAQGTKPTDNGPSDTAPHLDFTQPQTVFTSNPPNDFDAVSLTGPDQFYQATETGPKLGFTQSQTVYDTYSAYQAKPTESNTAGIEPGQVQPDSSQQAETDSEYESTRGPPPVQPDHTPVFPGFAANLQRPSYSPYVSGAAAPLAAPSSPNKHRTEPNDDNPFADPDYNDYDGTRVPPPVESTHTAVFPGFSPGLQRQSDKAYESSFVPTGLHQSHSESRHRKQTDSNSEYEFDRTRGALPVESQHNALFPGFAPNVQRSEGSGHEDPFAREGKNLPEEITRAFEFPIEDKSLPTDAEHASARGPPPVQPIYTPVFSGFTPDIHQPSQSGELPRTLDKNVPEGITQPPSVQPSYTASFPNFSRDTNQPTTSSHPGDPDQNKSIPGGPNMAGYSGQTDQAIPTDDSKPRNFLRIYYPGEQDSGLTRGTGTDTPADAQNPFSMDQKSGPFTASAPIQQGYSAYRGPSVNPFDDQAQGQGPSSGLQSSTHPIYSGYAGTADDVKESGYTATTGTHSSSSETPGSSGATNTAVPAVNYDQARSIPADTPTANPEQEDVKTGQPFFGAEQGPGGNTPRSISDYGSNPYAFQAAPGASQPQPAGYEPYVGQSQSGPEYAASQRQAPAATQPPAPGQQHPYQPATGYAAYGYPYPGEQPQHAYPPLSTTEPKKSGSGTAWKVGAGVLGGAAVASLATAGIMHALHDDDDHATASAASGADQAAMNVGQPAQPAPIPNDSDVDDSDAYASTVDDSSDLGTDDANSFGGHSDNEGADRGLHSDVAAPGVQDSNVEISGSQFVFMGTARDANAAPAQENMYYHGDNHSVADSSDLDTDGADSVAAHSDDDVHEHAMHAETQIPATQDPNDASQFVFLGTSREAEAAQAQEDDYYHNYNTSPLDASLLSDLSLNPGDSGNQFVFLGTMRDADVAQAQEDQYYQGDQGGDDHDDSVDDSSHLDTDDADSEHGHSESGQSGFDPDSPVTDEGYTAYPATQDHDATEADNQYSGYHDQDDYQYQYQDHDEDAHDIDNQSVSDSDDHPTPDSDQDYQSDADSNNLSVQRDTDHENVDAEAEYHVGDQSDHAEVHDVAGSETGDVGYQYYPDDQEPVYQDTAYDANDYEQKDSDEDYYAGDNAHYQDYHAEESDEQLDEDEGHQPYLNSEYQNEDEDEDDSDNDKEDSDDEDNQEVDYNQEHQYQGGYTSGADEEDSNEVSDEDDDDETGHQPEYQYQREYQAEDSDENSDEDDDGEQPEYHYHNQYEGADDDQNEDPDEDSDENDDEDDEGYQGEYQDQGDYQAADSDDDDDGSDEDDEDEDGDEENEGGYQPEHPYQTQNQYVEDDDDDSDDDDDEDEDGNQYSYQTQYQQAQPEYQQEYQQEYVQEYQPQPTYQQGYQQEYVQEYEPEPTYQQEYQQEYYEPQQEYQQEYYEPQQEYQQEYYEPQQQDYQQEYYEPELEYQYEEQVDYGGGYEEPVYDYDGGDDYEEYD